MKKTPFKHEKNTIQTRKQQCQMKI